MWVNIALSVIGLVALFLAWHPKYEDGLTGRVSLAGIVVVCVVVVVGQCRGLIVYEFSPEINLFIFCVAWFFVRHCYRFILWAQWGRHAWKAQRKAEEPDCVENQS